MSNIVYKEQCGFSVSFLHMLYFSKLLLKSECSMCSQPRISHSLAQIPYSDLGSEYCICVPCLESMSLTGTSTKNQSVGSVQPAKNQHHCLALMPRIRVYYPYQGKSNFIYIYIYI